MKILIILISFLWPVNVLAESLQTYFSVGTGFHVPIDFKSEQPQLNLHTGITGLGAIGIERNKWRYELEYGYRNISYIYEGKLKKPISVSKQVHTFMGNAYRKFKTYGFLNPYLGLGVGGATQDQTAFGVQGMLGTTTDFTKRFSSDLEYRYFHSDILKTHGMNINLRYSF